MKIDWLLAESLFDNEKLNKLNSIFSRDKLSLDRRILCLTSSLQALGDTDSLSAIIRLVVKDKDDLKQVYETLLQGYLFCGYPKAIESVFCFANLIKHNPELNPKEIIHKPFDLSEELLERGRKTARKVHKDKWEKINNKVSDFCPDLGYLMITEGYAHIISRDGLGLEERELAIVASLTVLKAYRQLNSHIRGARNVGCNDDEVYEAIITAGIWTHPDSVNKALDVLSEITDYNIGNSSETGVS